MKERTFVGEQIPELFKNENFDSFLPENEQATGETFRSVIHKYLENRRAGNYAVAVNERLQHTNNSFATCNLRSTSWILILASSPQNCVAVRDERGCPPGYFRRRKEVPGQVEHVYAC